MQLHQINCCDHREINVNLLEQHRKRRDCECVHWHVQEGQCHVATEVVCVHAQEEGRQQQEQSEPKVRLFYLRHPKVREYRPPHEAQLQLTSVMTTTIILHGHSVIVQVYVVSAIGVRASITVGIGLFHKVLQLRIAHLGRNVHALVHLATVQVISDQSMVATEACAWCKANLFWAMKLQRVALFVGCWESVQTEKLTAESKLNVVLLHGFAALDDFSREVLNGEVNIC